LIARALRRQGTPSGQPRTLDQRDLAGPSRQTQGRRKWISWQWMGTRAISGSPVLRCHDAQTSRLPDTRTPDGCSVRRGGCGGHSHATGPGTNRCTYTVTFSSGGAEKMTQHSQSPGLTGTFENAPGWKFLTWLSAEAHFFWHRIKSNIPQHCRRYLYRWLEVHILSDSRSFYFLDFHIPDIYILTSLTRCNLVLFSGRLYFCPQLLVA
jgi:hypothetical protein